MVGRRCAALQYGIIGGGLADGSICLWDPAPLVEGSGANPLLSKMQKHAGAVGWLWWLGDRRLRGGAVPCVRQSERSPVRVVC